MRQECAKKPFIVGEELNQLADKDFCRDTLGEAEVKKASTFG